MSACGSDFRNCFLRSSTAFMSRILSGVVPVDLCEGNDLILPLDKGRGLYSGVSGIGGGRGRALAGLGDRIEVAPCEGGRGGSCFRILRR